MKIIVFASLAAFSLLVAVARGQETITVEGAEFKIPQHWTKTERDGLVVLTPPDLASGVTCTLTLLGGEPFTGPVKDQLDAEWKGFEKLGAVVGDSGDSIDGAGGPVEIGGRSARIDLDAQRTLYTMLIVAKANQRVEKLVFSTNDFEAFQKHAGTVSQVVAGIKYVVPKPPEPLKGVCLGFSKQKESSYPDPECWIFLPDGVVYVGFPREGTAEMDLPKLLKQEPYRFGKYRVDGDDVVVTMKDEKEPTRLTPSRGAWTAAVTRQVREYNPILHGGDLMSLPGRMLDTPSTLRIARADPCDGLKLFGAYRGELFVLHPIIHFTADGEFMDEGAVRSAAYSTLNGDGSTTPTVAPEKGGRGRYAIASNTITFTYESGTKIRMTFMVTKDDLAKKNPPAVYLNRFKLLLEP